MLVEGDDMACRGRSGHRVVTKRAWVGVKGRFESEKEVNEEGVSMVARHRVAERCVLPGPTIDRPRRQFCRDIFVLTNIFLAREPLSPLRRRR